MMKHLFTLFTFLCLSTGVLSQQTSTYLNDPSTAVDIITNEVDFWSQYKDGQYGGFHNMVDINGGFDPQSDKSFCAQSRLAYAFARAFMVTGDTSYLEDSRHALNFMYEHSWDPVNGGWYFAADYDGNNPEHNVYNDGKWSFMQHYALLGIAAMHEATGGTISWNDGNDNDSTWLYRGLDVINENLWDNRTGLEGYYDIAENDWSNPQNKGFTPTADAMTTHATIMAINGSDSFYRTRFFTLADQIADKVIPDTYTSSSPLIYEYADTDWEPFGDELFNGHAIKCAWQLARAYMLDTSKTIYKEKAQQVLNESLARNHYDDTYGGVHYFNEGGQKNLWTQEQAILGGILNALIADDETTSDDYFALADGSMKFVEDYMVDFTDGGSYTDVNPDGSVSGAYAKGDYWEAAYHMVELSYYLYLYGDLLVNKSSAELYYYYEPKSVGRSFTLTPITTQDEELIIDEVWLDGESYTDFDAESRTLNLAANTGGKFRVKYRYNPGLIPCPVVQLGSDQSICGKDSIVLDPEISTDTQVAFSWTKDDSIIAGPDSSTSTLTIHEAGTYALQINGENCDQSDQVVITDDIPFFSLGEDFVLTDETAILLANLEDNNYTYTWYLDGNPVAGATSSELTITSPGTYSLSVSGQSCGTQTDTIEVLGQPSVLYTTNPPNVDGSMDAAYEQITNIKNGLIGDPTPQELSANWSAVWDSTNIYVYVAVTDADLNNDSGTQWWEDDGVEIFIDGDNSKGTSYDNTNDFQWGFVWNRSTVLAGANNPGSSTEGIEYSIENTPEGYVLEAAIPWSTIGIVPEENSSIGFDVAVNDDDGGAGRDHKIAWHTTSDDSWQNPSLFGTLNLSPVPDTPEEPVAHAGEDFTIQLPATSTELDGTQSSTGNAFSYAWSLVSGPNSITIAGDSTLTPSIDSFTVDGTYTFMLTVSGPSATTDSDSVTVTVLPAPISVTGVTITQAPDSIEAGQTTQLSADVSPEDADNKAVTWSVDDEAIATIDTNGLVTAVSEGTATFIVTTEDGGFTDQVTITILPETLPLSVDAGSGQSVQLPEDSALLSGTSSGGKAPVQYSWQQVSGPATATIQDDEALETVVSQLAEGDYTFTLTAADAQGDSATSEVTISVLPAPISVTGVTITQAPDSIEAGQTTQLSADVSPEDADNKAVTWSVDDEAIATIDTNGLVTAVSEGTATFIVTTEDGGFTDQVTITILPETLPLSVDAGSGQSVQLPEDSALLSGTSSGGKAPVQYSWQQVSGPATATIQDDEALETVVSQLAEGDYTFTLTAADAQGDSATSEVTISVLPAPISVTGVTITQAPDSIEAGQTTQLSADVSPEDADNKAVTWSVDDEAIATIDTNGLVTAVSEGTATFIVTTEDGGFTDQTVIDIYINESEENCTLTANPPASEWVLQNSWNDGQSGSDIDNTSEALIVTHRPWGKEEVFITQTGQSSELISGEQYTVTFELKDNSGQLTDVEVGYATGTNWSGPAGYHQDLIAVDPGFSSSFTTKEVMFTSQATTSSAYLVFRFSLNRNANSQEYLIKNLEVCTSDGMAFKLASEEPETKATPVEKTLKAYPVPSSHEDITAVVKGFDGEALPELVLTDMQGREMFRQQASGETQTIPTAHFPAGMYILSAGNLHKTIIIK